MSVGGWNGAHLDHNLGALGWYQAFRTILGNVIPGIEWDLEGNRAGKSV
jgi:hypothetical protein